MLARLVRSFLFAVAALAATSGAALAQSGCPSITFGAVLTAAQWQQCFSGKLDYPGAFASMPPLTFTTPGNIVTFGLSYDSSFALYGTPATQLGLASIATGRVLGNATGVSAEPVASTLTSLFDTAFCSSSGSTLVRGASTWSCGTSVAGPGSSTNHGLATWSGTGGGTLESLSPITVDNTGFMFGISSMSSATGNGIGIVGTNNASNACAGCVGEFALSNVVIGSAVSLTSGTATDITSILLSQGDWDVRGQICFNPAASTSITALQGATNTSVAIPGGGAAGTGLFSFRSGATVTGAGPLCFAIDTVRSSAITSVTYHLVANAVFTVSTLGAYGKISARRVR